MRTLFLLLALACLPPRWAAAEDLRVALGMQDSAAAPGGGLSAFNEDLAREICRRIAARCTTVKVVFADILPGVEAGHYDLGFGNTLRTPEREQRVAFSDPLWRSSSRLVAASATARRFARRGGGEITVNRLRGVRVVSIENSQQHHFLRAIGAPQRLTLRSARTTGDALRALRQGEADFALLPMLSAYAWLAREGAGQFEFVGPPMADQGLGGSVHIALPKDNDALRREVNRALAAIRADGSYHRLTRQHFPFSLD